MSYCELTAVGYNNVLSLTGLCVPEGLPTELCWKLQQPAII